MDWLPLAPLDLAGARAQVINRRIATHLKLRNEVNTGNFRGGRFAGPQDAHREAIRREIFIRRDAAILLKQEGLDSASHEAAFTTLIAQLEEIE